MTVDIPFCCSNSSSNATKDTLLHGVQELAAEAAGCSRCSLTHNNDSAKVRKMGGILEVGKRHSWVDCGEERRYIGGGREHILAQVTHAGMLSAL